MKHTRKQKKIIEKKGPCTRIARGVGRCRNENFDKYKIVKEEADEQFVRLNLLLIRIFIR